MKGLFVARQPGTIHAFEALIRDLEQQKVLTGSKLVSLSPILPNLTSFPEVEKETYDFLMTGTSLQALEDSRVWKWAKHKGIPTWAFHDQWTSTEERFRNVETLPDHIFVVDEAAKKLTENLQLQVPVTVIGSPLWGQIHTQRKPQPSLVTFATEPIPDPHYKTNHGFDDLDSLKMALSALGQTEKEWNLEILLHPIDQKKRIEEALRLMVIPPMVKVSYSQKSKPEIFEKTYYLFGMRSMILVEASLAGVPVISFQPHRKTASPATDREGIQVVTELAQATEAFAKALENKPRLPELSSAELFSNFLKTRVQSI